MSPASRVAVLIDAEEYYRALIWAMEHARRSIFILSWDIDSRIRLTPDDPRTLADLLLELVERNPELQIRILTWDYLLFYANERESRRAARRRLGSHPRIRFVYDRTGPLMVSLHQKVVVVDDEIGFCGGLDITQRRWDTRHHRIRHPFRRDPDGKHYGPFHDVEILVEGDIALELRRVCNERWKLCTGESLPLATPAMRNPGLWPAGLEPLLTDHPVALSRTQPPHEERPGIHECKELFVDSIRRARRYIFAENQYFTSAVLGDALGARLQEDDPPEIVILVREESSSWLESLGVPVMRARLVRRLKKADRHGRLRVLCPIASQKEEVCINLHSKVFIVDDELLRIGSSNLNARSEGMDVECDLALEGRTPDQKRAIRSVRDRLLAEHLGIPAVEFERAADEEPSLLRAIARFQGREDRTVGDCPERAHRIAEWLTPNTDLVDPPGPDRFNRAVARLAMQVALGVALIALLPHAIHWLREDNLRAAAEWVHRTPLAPIGMTALFALLTLLAVPLLPLAILFSLILPPVATFFCTMTGALISASILWRFARRRADRREGFLARIRDNEAFEKLRGLIERQGWWPIALVRFTPVAPYWVVNVALGILGVRYWHFVLSAFIGLLPGFILISIFEDRIQSQGGLLQKVVMLVVAFVALGWATQKTVQHFSSRRGLHAHGG